MSDLLHVLALRIRGLRKERAFTAREVAKRSGLSLRYYNHLEAGTANISIERLATVAKILGISLGELFRREKKAPIALLGLRGAGKSTIGPKLARSLRCPFIELDHHIERAAGLTLTEIFTLHGEPYYRKLESDCLREILSRGEECVIATPGGVVRNEEVFSRICRNSTTVWLRAKPEDHMKRVYLQGDARPMANRENAMEELKNILHDRESYYGMADIVIDTSAYSVVKSVKHIGDELRQRGWKEFK